MLHVYYLLIFTYIITLGEIGNATIQNQLSEYYNNAKDVNNLWSKYQSSYENSLSTLFTQTFGRYPANVFLTELNDHLRMHRGFLVSDNNSTYIFLKNMRLTSIPYPETSTIKFALPSNYLTFETVLERIIIQSEYYKFKTASTRQGPKFKSPFDIDSIQDEGTLAIMGENCRLTGKAVIFVNNGLANLGHHDISLRDCIFSVEISNVEKEPVIAPYFTESQQLKLESILSAPMRWEVEKQLQSALYAVVNTTQLFGDKVSAYSKSSMDIYEATNIYLNGLIESMNADVINNKKMPLNLPPIDLNLKFKYSIIEYKSLLQYAFPKCLKIRVFNKDSNVHYQDMVGEESYDKHFKLSEVKISGLDTLYSYHKGGPLKMDTIKISEKLGFSNIQISGKLEHNFDNDQSTVQQVNMELTDLSLNIIFDARLITRSDSMQVTINDIGYMEITIYDNKFEAANPMIQALLYGYVYDAVPDVIINFLKENCKISDSKQTENKNDDAAAVDPNVDKLAGYDSDPDYDDAEDTYVDLRKKLTKLKAVIKRKNKRKSMLKKY